MSQHIISYSVYDSDTETEIEVEPCFQNESEKYTLEKYYSEKSSALLGSVVSTNLKYAFDKFRKTTKSGRLCVIDTETFKFLFPIDKFVIAKQIFLFHNINFELKEEKKMVKVSGYQEFCKTIRESEEYKTLFQNLSPKERFSKGSSYMANMWKSSNENKSSKENKNDENITYKTNGYGNLYFEKTDPVTQKTVEFIVVKSEYDNKFNVIGTQGSSYVKYGLNSVIPLDGFTSNILYNLMQN